MSDDKPLHVRTAEALGWTGIEHGRFWVDEDGKPEGPKYWFGLAPHGYPHRPMNWGASDESALRWQVPYYDTSWSATGPLIEKYRIDVDCERRQSLKPDPTAELWSAAICDPDQELEVEYGSTPLLAVCNLLIKLGEAGKP